MYFPENKGGGLILEGDSAELADAGKHGEYSPTVNKQMLLDVIGRENPNMIVFCHTSYGWDLASRIAWALKAAQVSEVVDYVDGYSCCSGM